VAVGLGRIRRGFEKYMSDLSGVTRDELTVTLFKGAGQNTPEERVPFLYPLLRAIMRLLPIGGLVGGRDYRDYKRDCLAYGLSLVPVLLRNRFDLVHFIDPPLAVILQRLRRIFRFRTRLVFTEGTLMPPPFYPPGVHIHLTAQETYEEALCMGVAASDVTLIPVGLHVEWCLSTQSREELRRKYGVPETTFVVLAVTAIRRIHKRVHYIIDEVSRMEGDVLLWIDGNPEDPVALELAQRKLGARCRITHVPSHDVAELHRLADVMVHAAVQEAYGLAVVEALCSGIPVLVHDSPHFEWLTQGRECLVDMSGTGNLEAKLKDIASRREEYAARSEQKAADIRRWLDWSSLAGAYVAMYRRLAASGPDTTAG